MVLGKLEPCMHTGMQKQECAQFHEDPFELAIEKASLKLLHSVCNIFHKGNPSTSSSCDLHHNYAEKLQNMQTRQHMHASVYNLHFATASLTFSSANKHQQDENAKNNMQIGPSNEHKGLTCTPYNMQQHDGDAKDEAQDSVFEPSCRFATAMVPIKIYQQNVDTDGCIPMRVYRPSCRFATTSLTFAPTHQYQPDEEPNYLKQEIRHPSGRQLLRHPLAILSYIPKDVSLFLAGAVAGATAKTITAPLDRIKLLMQVYGVKATQEITEKSINFLEAAIKIGKEEGVQGFWKGNLPQVIRVIPYSAVQLLSYELYKKLFKGTENELSVAGRLAAGACAGMTSTLVTYPLDVLRLRLAVDPACKSMVQVASTMLKEEGLSSFYRGLGPSLVGIAPYIALNFCAFDLIKNSLPEEIRKTPTASFLTAFLSASLATTLCYPLDTIRRQLQMKGTPYLTVFDAFPGIIAKDGVLGLYRGFIPNALKNLPNSSFRLTTFDAAKNLISASEGEFRRLLTERRGDLNQVDLSSAKRS